MDKLIEFSFVGPLHNAILQGVTELKSFPNFTQQEMYDLSKTKIEKYYSDNHLGNPSLIDFYVYQKNLNDVLSHQDDVTAFLNDLKSNGIITPSQLEVMLSINEVFTDAVDSNKVANSMFEIANAIALDTSMTFSEQLLVYGAAIIGANSAPYWYAAYTNPEDPWYSASTSNGLKAKKRHWWLHALLDVVGFAVGAWAGGQIDDGAAGAGGTVLAAACSGFVQ